MPATAKVWRWPLHWKILLGLAVGALLGLWVGWWAVGQIPADTQTAKRGAAGAALATGTTAYTLFDLVGDLFLNGLKLIIVPLVTTSIVLAVVNIGVGSGFGRLS
ncbi:MAG: cation:dicarboxylate symporter family transporter, partial [Phycisphaerae bacterium]